MGGLGETVVLGGTHDTLRSNMGGVGVIWNQFGMECEHVDNADRNMMQPRNDVPRNPRFADDIRIVDGNRVFEMGWFAWYIGMLNTLSSMLIWWMISYVLVRDNIGFGKAVRL